MAWPTSWYATSDLLLLSTIGVPSMPATMRSTLSSISFRVTAVFSLRPVRMAACEKGAASERQFLPPEIRVCCKRLLDCPRWVAHGGRGKKRKYF